MLCQKQPRVDVLITLKWQIQHRNDYLNFWLMEKYSNPKTIGDGTYGSVLKAVNTQNGKSPLPHACRWNRGHKEDEKEVPPVGPVHLPKRNPVVDQTLASKHRPALWSGTGAKHFALCVWIFGHERIPVNERQKEAFSRAHYPQHNVPITLGPCLHAQIKLHA